MIRPSLHHAAAYLIAVGSTGLAFAVIWSAQRFIEGFPIALPLILPVLASAVVGGLGPSLVSTILVTLGYGALEPRGMDDTEVRLRQLFLISVGLFIAIIGDRMRRHRESSAQRSIELAVLQRRIDEDRAKEAELTALRDELQSRLGQIETLYATAPIGLGLVDDALRFIRVNSLLASVGDLPPDTHIGRSVREVLPHFADTLEPKLQRVLDTAEPVSPFELGERATNQAREQRLFIANCSPLRSPMGHVIGVNIAINDITSRKRAEQALRESEQRLRQSERLYRAIGESIDYGVWTRLPDGQNAYCSESFLHLVGLTPTEWVGDVWEKILPAQEVQPTRAAWQDCVRRGALWDRELRVRGVDGEWHPVLSRGVPVKGDDGSILYWAGIHLDVRQIKDAEQALRELDQRKNNFLAVLAHELRNPLTPILTAAQLLKRYGNKRPELTDWASDSIERQVRQLTHLINKLLDVSRIARGKLELRKKLIDLNPLIRQAIERCRMLAEEQHSIIQSDLPTEELYVNGDPSRLAQALDELLINAIKFTPSGGRIDINVAIEPKKVVIRVRDTGIGLQPAALEEIFQPFFQVEEPTARKHGGLGISLALSRSLIAMHGGTLRAHSVGLGRGSEFVIELPAIEFKAIGHEEGKE